jgi:hypothetical protein
MGKVSTLMTTIILVAVVFTGMITFLGGLQEEYGFEINENYTNVYSNISNAYENIDYDGMEDATKDASEGSRWFSWMDTITSNIGNTFSVIYDSGGVATSMVATSSTALGLPPWLINPINILIGILIILMVGGYLMNRDL